MKKKSFQGNLGSYHIETTNDGSISYYSEHFGELCHSSAGAQEETLFNYIQGCECVERSKSHKPFVILEVGFGTGLGFELTLASDIDSFIFVTTELDEGLALHSLKELKNKEVLLSFERTQEKGLVFFKAKTDKGLLIVLIGNARETIKKWRQSHMFIKAHAIYQDPFSPKKNPSLWTYQWFEDLKSISDPEVILSTYSSTKAVWKAMMKAGWSVSCVKGYALKKLSTRARLSGESGQNIIEWCERSPTPALSD